MHSGDTRFHEIIVKADINRARREVILITKQRAFYIAVYDIWSVSCTQQLTFIYSDGSVHLFTKQCTGRLYVYLLDPYTVCIYIVAIWCGAVYIQSTVRSQAVI